MSDKVNIKLLKELFVSQPLPIILGGNESTHGGLKEKRSLTADEEVVVDAICDTIAVDRSIIYHDTNIFEIGIDSLGAINLSVRLRNAGLSASVGLIMTNAVVQQLARLPCNSTTASEQGPSSGVQKRFSKLEFEFFDSHSPKIAKSSVSCVRPCLPLQEGLVARSMNSDSAIYVNHVVLKMNPAVDPVRLQNAWQKTSEQTEILRTVFVPLPSEIVQVVLEPNRRVDWTERQYNGLEEAMADFQIRQDAISQDITDNITPTPPLRICHAVTMGSRQPLALFISIHHSLYDGASFGMLLQDFVTQYGQDKPLPRRDRTGASHSVIVNQQSLRNLQEARLNFPTPRYCHPPSRSSKDARLAYNQHYPRSCRQFLLWYWLMQWAHLMLLTAWYFLEGRFPLAGADSVLLPCIATIPGRLNTEHLSTVEDVIRQVHKATAESLEYQHTSLRYIQRWVKSDGPIFDCLFSFIKATEDPGHDLWEEMESTMPSDYPLALEVEADAKNDCVRTTCGFAPAFGQPEYARDFVAKMNLIVSTIVSNESISLDSFSLSRSVLTTTKSTVKDWDDHPWSSLEFEICDMLKCFCGLEGLQISRNSSFLSLGLDSVTAIRFSSQLRDAGIPVSSADVMRFPCVGALAQSVVDKAAADVQSPPQSNCDDDSQLDEFASQVERLSPNDTIGPIFKCSPLQTAMISQTIASNGVVYVHPHIMRLAESTSVERVKEAYRLTTEANDILRTSFHSAPQMDSTWIGVVHSDVPPAWQEIAVPTGSDIAQAAMRCIQLGTGSAFCTPPIRPVIVNEPGGRLLVIVMHHSLYDGVSLPFIFDDLASAYRGVSLPDRPPFANAVRPLSQHQSEACQFWTKLFDGYHVIPLSQSLHHQPTAGMFYSESDIELSMPDISERCKEMEVTVQSVAILAYAKVLAKSTGRRDVAFGQVLAGRSSLGSEAERVVGPLFNTVAKRVTLEPELISNRNMVQQIQSFTVEAQSYEHAPLHEVQKSLRQNGVLCSATLVDTLFVFEKNVQTEEHDLAYHEIWKPYVADGYIRESEYKLNLQVEQTDKVVTVRASCYLAWVSSAATKKAIS
ncbi:nonribosomal siderophore peptide synthase [Fusarium albosuccineum]|uniref:Nonribosomal siderophore peptide synthase n=1 Tax=Fusarium albosuccineum TaxID=1237068 RepID=A0A8H4P5P6_9HYPO|nr:nonribosomal siderophore peptide synthase [Fusarium albosuccineum]